MASCADRRHTDLPFQWYQTFVIEERFGFNKTTYRTFFIDKIKSWLVAAVLGGGLLALVVWIYEATGSWFWIIAWIVIMLFSVFLTMFYTSTILPLFNKLTPLESGDLRTEIETFAKKTDFRLANIYVMDSSKRTSKANAFFSGLGRQKKIVLFDTLIKDHTTEELVAVLAHEIGHYKKQHTKINVLLSGIQSFIMLFILSVFIDKNSVWPQYFARVLGAEQPSFHLGILVYGLLYSPVSTLLGIGMNYISRKHEYEADRFAAIHYGANPLQEALKKLSVNSLSHFNPHPAVVFIHYTHPSLVQRLKHLDNFKPNP